MEKQELISHLRALQECAYAANFRATTNTNATLIGNINVESFKWIMDVAINTIAEVMRDETTLKKSVKNSVELTPMTLISLLDSGMVEELTMYYNGRKSVVNIRNLPELMPDYNITKLWNSETGKGISVLLADDE